MICPKPKKGLISYNSQPTLQSSTTVCLSPCLLQSNVCSNLLICQNEVYLNTRIHQKQKIRLFSCSKNSQLLCVLRVAFQAYLLFLSFQTCLTWQISFKNHLIFKIPGIFQFYIKCAIWRISRFYEVIVISMWKLRYKISLVFHFSSHTSNRSSIFSFQHIFTNCAIFITYESITYYRNILIWIKKRITS